jgi:biotin carboxylase
VAVTSRRVVLFATTTGYQTRSFGEAAARVGVDVVLATDRCKTLDDPWRDQAIPVRFHDERGSVRAIARAARMAPFTGVLAVGDRPVPLAAAVANHLDLPWHPLEGAAASRNKQLARARWRAAGLPVPWFTPLAVDADLDAVAPPFPCVVKPLVLSGSRGVIRADDLAAFRAAFTRVRALLRSREVKALREPEVDTILVEEYLPGDEYAVEGVLDRGTLRLLAIFDKPDPLTGPYFEETIYVTPSRAAAARQQAIETAVADAARALSLWHGPVHAECRVDGDRVWVLEVAARPIGGLCARALRFSGRAGEIGLEELLLRHAAGEAIDGWTRERLASGVMMVPIPARGVFRRVDGVNDAMAVPCVEDVRITAKTDQVLVPLPEAASYLGFIFARGERPEDVEGALREAHERLRFVIDRPLTVAPA